MYMQGNYKNLVKDKFGETSIAPDDVALDDEATTELVAPRIPAIDDAELFYKAAGGSKKGRVYGLGSEGILMAATQNKSFVPPQVQPNVDEIVATPSFKKALDELLNERDRQAADRQREAEQQMVQLRTQLSAVLATLTALTSQSSSNSNAVPPLGNQPPNVSDQSPSNAP